MKFVLRCLQIENVFHQINVNKNGRFEFGDMAMELTKLISTPHDDGVTALAYNYHKKEIFSVGMGSKIIHVRTH